MGSDHPKAFISHASEDQPRFVTDFARRLRGKGVDAWYSKWEMQPGDKLIERIFDEGVGNADTLIVILSKVSVAKPWVREEIDVAFVRRVEKKLRRLIPVVIDDCQIPVALQSTLYIRIRNLDSYDAELAQIVSAIFGLSDKPVLGSLPSHTQAPYVGIPHLARMDNIILRLACELVIETDRGFDCGPEILWLKVEPLGISRQDMDDALIVLDQNRFIEGFRGDDRIIAFTISLYGFHEFAKAYVPDLDSILHGVIARIVNEELTDSQVIARSLGQPHLIVEYILSLLANNNKLQISQPIGRSVYVANPSPELKRMLQ